MSTVDQASTDPSSAEIRGAARRAWLRSRAQSPVALGVTGLVLAAIAWQIAALTLDNPLVLPSLTSIGGEMAGLAVDPQVRGHLLDTLGRVATGFVLGSAIGLAVGSSIGSFAIARRFLNPYLNFLRSVAPIAWIVPATIWLGVGESSILFVVVYAAVFPVAINTISGIAAVDADKIRMGRSFGLAPLGIFWRILVPSATPYVLVGARLALGFSFMAVIGAEMIIGRSGLGYLIYDARTYFNTALMFAGIVVLGVVGYLGDLLFVTGRRTVFGRFYAGRVDG